MSYKITNLPHKIKPSALLLYVIVIFGFVASAFMAAISKNGFKWVMITWPWWMAGPMLIIAASHKIVIYRNKIVYFSVWKRQEVPFSRIKGVYRVKTRNQGGTSWWIQFILKDSEKPLNLHMTIYDSGDIDAILDIFREQDSIEFVEEKLDLPVGR